MPVEIVVDASVLAAIFFREPGHPSWEEALGDDALLIAPTLLCVEMASIAAKKIWRREANERTGAQAVRQCMALTDRPVADTELAPRAMELAARHRFSAYDATYMALAEARSTHVVTLDGRWVDRAATSGLGALVRLPA